MMKRILEAEEDYTKYHGQKAIEHFFSGRHSNLTEWKEAFEWMLETGTDFYSDNYFADGTKNNNWTYALHFDDSEDYTYMCIILREAVDV